MSNSNLVVKMMSGQDLMDTNTSKGFTLVEAHGEVTCLRGADGKPSISIPLEGGQVALYHPEGNTYVIKNGKTVASFAYSEYKDAKVTRIKGVAQAFQCDPNKPVIVHETSKLIHYKVSSLLNPMIVPHAPLQGRDGEFYVAVDMKEIGLSFVIYPGSEILIQDPVTRGARVLSYADLLERLEKCGPHSLQGELNPVTLESFTDYDLLFTTNK